MRSLLLDLILAVRTLRKTPLFTSVAAGTLALGIAFSTIIFAVVNSVLLKPLPYPDPDKLVVLQGQERRQGRMEDLTAPTFFFVQEHSTTLEDVAAIYPVEAGVNLAGVGTPTYVSALRVSSDFFRALRVMPLTGRTFVGDEDKPNGARVAVLSYNLWKRTFSPNQSVIGSEIRIDGEQYTAIGLMPASFRSYPDADLWLPLQLSPGTADPGADYRVLARIKAEASIQHAREELRQLSEKYPLAPIPAAERDTLRVQMLHDFARRDLRDQLGFLLSAVFLVLLIACANIAMLLLVRASARTSEIAIRTALGSPRRRLIQIFFLESAIITVLGGLFGIILARELMPVVLALVPPGLPLTTEIRIDWRVAAFAFAVSALTAMLFGLVPMVKLSQFELKEMLSEAMFGTTTSPRQVRTGRLLLVAQIALTSVLLFGSMLLFRHLLAVQAVQPGFDTRRTSVTQVSLVARRYQTTAATASMLENLTQEIKALPFVEGVASINGLPLEKGLNMPMRPAEASGRVESSEYRLVSRDYFAVMHIPMVQGRPFSATDKAAAQPVAIVNETLARRSWPDAHALGHFLVVGEAMGQQYTEKPRLVVGVVADVRESRLDVPARPTVFVPLEQVPDKITGYANKYFFTSIVTRTTVPEDMSVRLRDAVESADPDLSVASFRPLSDVVTNSLSQDRFYAFLTTGFGSFALFITAVGLYGLMSYQVGLRTQEIAVRMSLGARRSKVVVLVVQQGMKLVGIGVLLGVAASFFFQRFFAAMLYNSQSLALGAIANAILLLGLVGVLASLLTAFRIASIDPLIVLRKE